ncbi:hypothetical protein PVAP13_2NG086046 [Panicum virgatum]|uniref:Uncharacterized protein n=1 Tax=Panicum virgatum TaxID=38727 RepID=A0A8T0V7K3_PANVG|nr:hypothetical protein PVAP13_2NG086046 [Panicum virgatum]
MDVATPANRKASTGSATCLITSCSSSLERLRGDARSLARTCVLSRRWRTLPLMVSELRISVSSTCQNKGLIKEGVDLGFSHSFLSSLSLSLYLISTRGARRPPSPRKGARRWPM